MRIFDRRVPLTEEQRREVDYRTIQAGKERLKDVIGDREQLFEIPEVQEMEKALSAFMARVAEKAAQREFFEKEEREEMMHHLAEKISAVLTMLEAQDKRRLASFISDEPESVEETLRSFDRDVADLDEQLEGYSEEDSKNEELLATKDDLLFFRNGLWRQVQLGHMSLDDKMSREERESFAQDVGQLGERPGFAQTGKTVEELGQEAAMAIVGEYERILAVHKVLIGLEAKYSDEEILSHLREAIPPEAAIDAESLMEEMKAQRAEGESKEITNLRLYVRLMGALFKGRALHAAGFSGGVALLGYLAPQMAGQFGEFGRTGEMGDAVEGAGFGLMSSLAQVELARRLSSFLNERLYTEAGLASRLVEAVINSSPDLFTKMDYGLVRKYVEDALFAFESVAQHSIEGLGAHLCRATGLAAASAMRLKNPALFGPVILAAAFNTLLALRGGEALSKADDEVREAAATFAKRFDEAVSVRVGRGGGLSVSSQVMERLKEARARLIDTASRYQHGQGVVMPVVLLLNAMLMDRSQPDFFADYAEGSMYSMQLSAELSSLVSDIGRLRQSLQPLARLANLAGEFRESGHVMPESWQVELTDLRYKALTVSHLKISPGEQITIVGESGSGKSTLLEMLYGFSPDRGLVLIDEIPKSDVDMRAYREGVAVANQFYAVESASFFENVISEQTPFDKAVFEEVVREHGFESWLRKVSGADDSEPLDTLVRRVVLNRDATLSGGERKRFGMMAIDYRMRVAPDTIKMILLDEPTFGADQMLKPVIFSMIARWREEHPDKTIVVVNHDPAFFDYLSDDSRVLGIEKDGTLSQNETLASAREHKNRPFHQVFVKAKSASSS